MNRRERLQFPDYLLIGALGVFLLELFFLPNGGALKSERVIGVISLSGNIIFDK